MGLFMQQILFLYPIIGKVYKISQTPFIWILKNN